MLLAFGGPLYGAEQWSISLRSTPNFADNDAVGLDRIADLVGDWHEGAPAVVGGFAPMTWLKFNRIGVDGKYVADRTNRVDFAPPRVNNTGSPHAPQVSLVATLETGNLRGLAHRGRMFLPCPTAAVSNDGRIPAAAAQAAATKVASLITALNADPSYGETRIYSNVREGASRLVTGVTVGRVLDTMRSRRTSLPEERTAVVTVGGS
jgi:hypothetical protein